MARTKYSVLNRVSNEESGSSGPLPELPSVVGEEMEVVAKAGDEGALFGGDEGSENGNEEVETNDEDPGEGSRTLNLRESLETSERN